MLEFASLAHEHGGWSASATCRPRTSRARTRAASARTTTTSASGSTTPTSSSKLEAEQLVRSSGRRCRRRSCARRIVVGDRAAAGPLHSTSSIGRCARSRAGCSRPYRPSRRAPVDVVSVDYVADAVYELCSRAAFTPGETFHLTAGDDASTIEEIAARGVPLLQAAAAEGCAAGGVRGGQRDGGRERRVLPVLLGTGRVRRRVRPRCGSRPAGITVTPLRDYLDRLLDFATRSPVGEAADHALRGAREHDRPRVAGLTHGR